MLGVTFNQAINFRSAIGRDLEKVFGEALHVGTHVSPLTPERLPHLLRILLSHIGLEKHLQREFAGFAAGSQSRFLVIRSSRLDF